MKREGDIVRLVGEILSLEKEIETLEKMSALLASGDQPRGFFSDLIGNIIEMLGAARGSLMLFDGEGTTLKIAAAKGIAPEIIKKTRLKLGEGIAGQVAESGEPVVLEDALSVPIIWKNHVLGVINVRHKKKGMFTESDLMPLMILANQAAIVLHEYGQRVELDETYLDMIVALAEAVDARDIYTFGHSKAVRDYATGIALKIGMDEDRLRRLDIAAVMHDLGKVSIPDSILLKNGRLTEEEYKVMKTHPERAAMIIGKVKYFADIVPIVLHHHEKYDGSGYPDGLKGEEIPLGARILAIADAFDAMSSKRVYRPLLKTDKILKNLREGRGRQFDPRLLDVFLKEFEIDKRIYRAGDNRLGDQLHERFNYYVMAVKDDPLEVERTLERLTIIISSWLVEVDKLAGPIIKERTIKKMNSFSIEHRLDFMIVGGKLDIDELLPTSLVELMKRFQAYFDYLLTVTTGALGAGISGRIINDVAKGLDKETRMIFDETIRVSRFGERAA